MTSETKHPDSGAPAPVFGDRPLVEPDQDALGRAPFAKALADSIRQIKDPKGFVFGIQGPWGSGKTTLINLVLRELASGPEEDRPVVVHFNPWWFSGSDDLLLRFFQQLALSLGSQPAIGSGLPKALKLLGSALAPVGLVWGALGKVGEVVARTGDAVETAREAVEMDVFAQRKAVEKALVEAETRILVVLDDLDRLESAELRDIFRLVKAVADFPNVTYLLAFDRAHVVQGLGLESRTWDSYLEKIVEHPFDLPPATVNELRELVLSGIASTLGEVPDHLWDSGDWMMLLTEVLGPATRTPRRAKRIVNAVRATYPPLAGEVHAVDFVALQVARALFPDVYDFISDNRDHLVGSSKWPLGFNVDRLKQDIKALVADQDERDREPIEQLLQLLFPRCRHALTDIAIGEGFIEQAIRQRRIQSAKVIESYFRLGVGAGQFSDRRFREVVAELETQLEPTIRSLAGNDPFAKRPLLSSFLERLWLAPDEIRSDKVPAAIASAIGVGQDVGPGVGASFLELADDEFLVGLVLKLLERLPHDNRLLVLRDAIERSERPALAIEVVADLDQMNRRESSGHQAALLSEESVAELKILAAEQLDHAAANGMLDESARLGRVCHWWGQWAGTEAPTRYLAQLTSTDRGFTHWVNCHLRFQHSSSGTEPRIQVDQVLEPLEADSQRARERCVAILGDVEAELSERERLALETLLKEIDEPRDGYGDPIPPPQTDDSQDPDPNSGDT